MAVLLPGTIAVALSSVAAAQSADPAELTPVTSTIAEAEPAAEAAPPGYVIVDIPAFNRQATTPSASELGESEASAEPIEATLNEAVVAAHDERIQLLRQHVDALQAEAGDKALLRDLRHRLALAEAARDKAVDRIGQREATLQQPAIALAPVQVPAPPRAQLASIQDEPRADRRMAPPPRPAATDTVRDASKPAAPALQRSRELLAAARQALDERRAVAGPLPPEPRAEAFAAGAAPVAHADPFDLLSPESAARLSIALAALLAAVAIGRGMRPQLHAAG
jgi:hypothetical protein